MENERQIIESQKLVIHKFCTALSHTNIKKTNKKLTV